MIPLRALLALSASLWSATAQLTTLDSPADVEAFVEALADCSDGACVLSDISYTGSPVASGIASLNPGHYVAQQFGNEVALILTTGGADLATELGNTDDGSTTNTNTPGDPDLDALIPQSTQNAAVLEFCVTYAQPGNVTFQYIFASEEYNEFVDSSFNDVFAFFIDGVNVATFNGSPVSINNINNGMNSEAFEDNDPSDNAFPPIPTAYDGITILLQTQFAPVLPGQKVTVKLAIADAGDSNLDSAVYLRGSSFVFVDELCGNGVVDPGEACDGGECCNIDCTIDTTSPGCMPSGDLCMDGLVDKTGAVCCAGPGVCSECGGCGCEEGPECCPGIIAATDIFCMVATDVECLLGIYVPPPLSDQDLKQCD